MSIPQLTRAGRYADSTRRHSHTLFVATLGDELPDLPERAHWLAVMKRQDNKVADLAKAPLVTDLPGGGRAACVLVDPAKPRFDRLTALRKGVTALLGESPKELAVVAIAVDADVIGDAIYVAAANGVPLPSRKKKPAKALARIVVYDGGKGLPAEAPLALARANVLARQLTALPPNVLTPAEYRRRLRTIAKERGWTIEEFGFNRLRKMGAGAFCAVAQGSDHQDAAIVRLAMKPKGARRRIALVGKGICFDTGGHNLKPAKYMAGMHEDMNGSAVALGLMQAIEDLGLPVAVDCWLAIAHNHLSPEAYKQGDVVTALDGTSIEVVHTDAEGRMVLADTLTMAARSKPELMVDFATLTGSMVGALGTRYCGVFASSEELAAAAVAAGRASGERVTAFPFDEDYDPALDSKVADVKQCTLEGEADHILAARFLQRFTGKRPWLHVDLSAASCSGGLGAIGSDLTGFGVAWGICLVGAWLTR
ncbi:MAG TPA: leucyl aminopeptidase family protein [Rhodocyclaceae bacterium]|nr:leucyl aminopeptidase family protein [Rhodocyclaceae bacterium]